MAVVVAVCPVSRSLSAAFRFPEHVESASAHVGGESQRDWLFSYDNWKRREKASCLASTSADISSVRSGHISETLSQQYWIFLLNDEYRLWILRASSVAAVFFVMGSTAAFWCRSGEYLCLWLLNASLSLSANLRLFVCSRFVRACLMKRSAAGERK